MGSWNLFGLYHAEELSNFELGLKVMTDGDKDENSVSCCFYSLFSPHHNDFVFVDGGMRLRLVKLAFLCMVLCGNDRLLIHSDLFSFRIVDRNHRSCISDPGLGGDDWVKFSHCYIRDLVLVEEKFDRRRFANVYE